MWFADDAAANLKENYNLLDGHCLGFLSCVLPNKSDRFAVIGIGGAGAGDLKEVVGYEVSGFPDEALD